MTMFIIIRGPPRAIKFPEASSGPTQGQVNLATAPRCFGPRMGELV